MIQILAFYLFAALVIASAVMVIMARNPVHSVLWLILAFFNAAGLMVLVGAEFIAMLLVIVYVGAVAVLFLFVVMMLDIDFRRNARRLCEEFPARYCDCSWCFWLSWCWALAHVEHVGGIELGTADGTASATRWGESNIEAIGVAALRALYMLSCLRLPALFCSLR